MAVPGGQRETERSDERGAATAELTSMRFAATARGLSEVARALGLEPPGFRSPPRQPGVRRTIRRERDGSATVAVALRDRPGVAVIGDMIDGIVVSAELSGIEAGVARDALWVEAARLLDDGTEARGSLPPAMAA